MGKRYIYVLWFAALLAAACERHQEPTDAAKSSPVGYALTRAGATPPENGTTYTFISYNKNVDGTFGPNTTYSNSASSSFIDPAYHQKPTGYYAYLDDPQYSGILQPCEVDDAAGAIADAPYGFIKRDPLMGQALYDGDFQTVCLYPAMPVTRIPATGSDRVLFHRTESLYASEPFDMRVDGYEIFELDLTTNADESKNRPLIEVRSKITVEFIQGSDYPFELKNLRLTNPGIYGWYHPLLQITGISYIGNDPNDIYDKNTNQTPGNEVVLVVVDEGEPDGDVYRTKASDTKNGDRLYWTGDNVDEGFFFFSNDYTKDHLLQPGIAFDLLMNNSGFKITVPLTMNMQRGYAYKFRLTVESLVIRATYREMNWMTGQEIKSETGGVTERILGHMTPQGWIPHGNMGGDIGR